MKNVRNSGNVGIKYLEYYLPEGVASNEYLNEKFGFPAEISKDVLNMDERRWDLEGEGFSSLAIKCGKKIFENENIKPEDIGVLVVATSSDDYDNPKSGSYIQHNLGTKAFVVNINQSCAGGVYALRVAQALMNDMNVENALVLSGESISKKAEGIIMSCLGDGCSGAVLSRLKEDKSGIMSYSFDSYGEGYLDFGLFDFGSKTGDKGYNADTKYTQSSSGSDILFRVLEWFKSRFSECLEIAGLTQDDIDFVIPHQAAISQINLQMQAIDFPASKTQIITDKTGHCGGGTMLIALKKSIESGNVKHNDKVFMFANGSGWVNGGVLLNINDEEDFV